MCLGMLYDICRSHKEIIQEFKTENNMKKYRIYYKSFLVKSRFDVRASSMKEAANIAEQFRLGYEEKAGLKCEIYDIKLME